jgi:hypothetical protein
MSSASVLTFLPTGDYLTNNSLLQLSTLNSRLVLLVTSWHGPHRTHRSSVAVSSVAFTVVGIPT